ncbi:MAG TPA: efflux RND transporter periplasmic adaptor subunit [Caulobacteraceae bacterium]|nr:efflux RND transporter periplasmic adaptor subunit [Caulobacteraceae bacterium]
MTENYPPPPRYAYSPAPRRSRLRTPLAIVVVILIALALAALLTFCVAQGGGGQARGGRGGGRGGFGGSAGGRPAITVGVAKAVSGDIPIQIGALGTVTPLATVSVNARVSGMLDKVAFREGQIVRKGQLLAQIDPRPFQAALGQARGQLAHDQALLADARLDLARYAKLHAEDSIATQTYDTQVALVRQDAATVVSDQANIQTAALNLSFTRIVAPIGGRVGLRQIDPGNQITANETTPFAVVTQVDPITVIFSVPESAIGPIERQGGAGLATTALDRAGGVVLAQGRLATLDNLIDTTTGTVKARSVFRNAGSGLFPNQFVNVNLLVDTLHNQVVVPTSAVRHGPQGDFVWVLQPDQTVKSRPVKVGPGTPETVSITSGLSLGETVITDGGDRLKEDARVVLPGQRPSSGFRSGGPGGHHRRGAGGWQGRRGGGQGGGGQEAG